VAGSPFPEKRAVSKNVTVGRTDVHVEHHELGLGEERRSLLNGSKSAGQEENPRDARDDQADAGDLAHVDELKDEYFTLAQTDSEILAQVRAALAQIDDSTFGRCVVDGCEFEPHRLEAVPWTPYCLKHQQQLEERLGLRTPPL
jgi:RNA polymerase-binding transcription factor